MDDERSETWSLNSEVHLPDFSAGLDASLGTIDVSNLFSSDLAADEAPGLSGVESTSFGKILNFLPTPALVVDVLLTILFSNDACRQIAAGFETVIGHSLASLMPRKRHAGLVRALVKKVLLDGKPRAGEVILGPGKGTVWGRLRLRSLRLGPERSILVIIEDLTLEKKQLALTRKYSEQLRKARDELELRVTERTSALLRANEDLRKEMDARLRVQDKLRDSEGRYRAVVEDQTELITRFLPDGTITFANEACCRYFGGDCAHMLGTSYFAWVHGDDLHIEKEHRLALCQENPVATFQIRVMAGERGVRWHQRTIRAIFDRKGVVQEYQCVERDVTEHKKAQEAVARAKEEWERTFDAVPDLVAIIDSDHKIARVNRAMAEVLGRHPTELIGASCHTVFHGLDRPLCECPLASSMLEGERYVPETIETSLNERTFAVSVSALRDAQGIVIGCVHVARDITRRKRLEEELKFRATRDSLTGLFSRSHFLETLELACATAKRYSQVLSVSIFDIDNFKDVNDQYGHLTGDLVLERFGHIVTKQLRSSDFAGRFGGDEFIIAFPHSGAEGAAKSVDRIRKGLAEHLFRAYSGSFHVGATAGVAEFVPQEMSMQDLIQKADMALYEAKASGRNRVTIYLPRH
jgi:diguanylate cyclase (GGDEF)-like protein/PAS domain S-box-containing protein